MNINLDDIVGKQFGRLTVIAYDHYEKYTRPNGKSQNIYYYKCKCSCPLGNEPIVSRFDLLRTDHPTKSCGCLVIEAQKAKAKHGMSNTKFYNAWQAMKQRCNDPNCKNYNNYGGRGITVDPDWDADFMNFYNDMYDSYEKSVKLRGERNTTLERVDVNKGYCKENCIWTDYHHQAVNKQDTKKYLYNGSYYTVTELYQNFAENISYTGFRDRINKTYHPGEEIIDDSIFYIVTIPIKKIGWNEKKAISKICEIQKMIAKQELLKRMKESN